MVYVIHCESGISSCGTDCAETAAVILIRNRLEKEGFSKKELRVLCGSLSEKQQKQLQGIVASNPAQIRIIKTQAEGKNYLFCTIRGAALVSSVLKNEEIPSSLTKSELIEVAFPKGDLMNEHMVFYPSTRKRVPRVHG